MIVCLCHRVTESQITRQARAGCASFEELQDDTRVATACGVCLGCARDTFDAARAGFDAARAACPGTCVARPHTSAVVQLMALA